MSVATVPLVVVPLIMGPSKSVDFLLGFVIPIHSHLGFGQIVTDYLNPRKIGVMGNGIAKGAVLLSSLTVTYGLYKFNTQDVGITEFVRRLWKGP